jgi:hypothetical protein
VNFSGGSGEREGMEAVPSDADVIEASVDDPHAFVAISTATSARFIAIWRGGSA